jgi:hypothetical protein
MYICLQTGCVQEDGRRTSTIEAEEDDEVAAWRLEDDDSLFVECGQLHVHYKIARPQVQFSTRCVCLKFDDLNVSIHLDGSKVIISSSCPGGVTLVLQAFQCIFASLSRNADHLQRAGTDVVQSKSSLQIVRDLWHIWGGLVDYVFKPHNLVCELES